MLSYIKNSLISKLNFRIIALLTLDFVLLPCALFSAVWLRLGGVWDPRLDEFIWVFFLLPLWTIPIFIVLGLYKAVLKYLDDKVVLIVFSGVTLSVLILIALNHAIGFVAFPRAAEVIFWLFSLSYIGGSRFLLRGLMRNLSTTDNKETVAIYGAGNAGVQLALSLIHGNEYNPIAFFDDDKQKWHTTIKGISVYSPSRLVKVIKNKKVKKVLLAIPSVTINRRRQIIKELEQNSIYVQTLPGVSDIVSGNIQVNLIKDVEIDDLLSRDLVPALPELLHKNISAKVVLVTGAGGSIGSELSRQITKLCPQTLLILDSSEFALYNIEKELKAAYPYVQIEVILGSVTSVSLVERIIYKFKVNTIYHAAAYKHVPMVEFNPLAGIENNVFGTMVLATAALKYNVDNMVLISTDKAVRPTNIMGASKRLAELILQALNEQSSHTVFSMVRFGNVLGSSGSVVPLFKQQIKEGGPIRVTHPEITRYFMTITEAVELVIQAGSMALGGEVFVLDMGQPVKIIDLAKQIIYLSGLTLKGKDNPDGDIEIQFTGLRAGEKLYEELLIGDNPEITHHPRIMKAHEDFIAFVQLKVALDSLRECVYSNNHNEAIKILQYLVKDYMQAPNYSISTDLSISEDDAIL